MENSKELYAVEDLPKDANPAEIHDAPLGALPKTKIQRIWPILAAGSGLFSDGYLNGVIGSVNTMLRTIYGKEYTNNHGQSNISSITFAGSLFGSLLFGLLSDYWSRRDTLLVSNIVLVLFAILGAGAYGGGTVSGIFPHWSHIALCSALELVANPTDPAGSTAAAESSAELEEGHRNRWFIFATDFAIDFGFVVAAIVPMIVVLITGEDHLRAAWRICLGIGVIWPFSVFFMRIYLKDPEQYQRQKMHKYPYWLIIKYYWWRLTLVSLIWMIYDFSAYSFGLYSSAWLAFLLSPTAPLWKSFGWNTVINFFYLPGSFFGAFLSDWIGPRYCLALGVGLQGIVGFIMAGCYKYLDTNNAVGGFVVIYGIFLALGEVGPGDNIGLLAAKTSATSVRGQYYGIAAAFGKVGAFVGTYIFPIIQADAPNAVAAGQYPFYVSSSLCIFSVFLVLLLPHIDQNFIENEDRRFNEYLEANGYDTSTLGVKEVIVHRQESVSA